MAAGFIGSGGGCVIVVLADLPVCFEEERDRDEERENKRRRIKKNNNKYKKYLNEVL